MPNTKFKKSIYIEGHYNCKSALQMQNISHIFT